MNEIATKFFALPVQQQFAWALVIILLIALLCWADRADRGKGLHK